MPSNIKLTADERVLWMMAYAAALGAYISRGEPSGYAVREATDEADAAITALRFTEGVHQ